MRGPDGHRSRGVRRALAHLPVSTRQGRPAQPPHHLRCQALSPASRRARHLPVRGRGGSTRRAEVGRRLQDLAAQASRRIRCYRQALRPRRRRPYDGAWIGPRRLEAERHPQLLPGTREQVRARHDREDDDEPAGLPAVPRSRRPLPARSRRRRSGLRPLAACRHAPVSVDRAGRPADCCL